VCERVPLEHDCLFSSLVSNPSRDCKSYKAVNCEQQWGLWRSIQIVHQILPFPPEKSRECLIKKSELTKALRNRTCCLFFSSSFMFPPINVSPHLCTTKRFLFFLFLQEQMHCGFLKELNLFRIIFCEFIFTPRLLFLEKISFENVLLE